MPLTPIRRVKAGQPVRASDFNALAEAVEAARALGCGDGINITMNSSGATIALANGVIKYLGKYLVVARITERNGADNDPPESVTYKAKAVNEDIELDVARVPDISAARNMVGVRIAVRAAVGDPCFFHRSTNSEGNPDLKLEVLTERAATTECAG